MEREQKGKTTIERDERRKEKQKTKTDVDLDDAEVGRVGGGERTQVDEANERQSITDDRKVNWNCEEKKVSEDQNDGVVGGAWLEHGSDGDSDVDATRTVHHTGPKTIYPPSTASIHPSPPTTTRADDPEWSLH